MKPELAALARHRMAQAHETLAEADQLLASQAFRGSVNRLYYATFYAARALLATRDIDAARHSGLITLFQQHFVKTGPRAGRDRQGLCPRLREAPELRLRRLCGHRSRGRSRPFQGRPRVRACMW